MCHEIIDKDPEAKSNNEGTKIVSKHFDEKNITCKTQNFYILFPFLLITITLLIAASIYCYLMKYQAKQKQLLTFHDINNKFKKLCMDNIN